MSATYQEEEPLVAEAETKSDDSMVVTRVELVDRLGEGAGAELFERLDEDYRSGERVVLASVREARNSFALARTPGRARLVRAQRPAKAGQGAVDEEMVLIALSDLEAVVKANTVEFNWANAFAPRADLPAASAPLTVRSGVRGHSLEL